MTSAVPIRRIGRDRYGDATTTIATMTARRTVGKRGASLRSTVFRNAFQSCESRRVESNDPADDPGGRTRDQEVARQAPAADEDCAEGEEGQGPDGQDLVPEDEQRSAVVGQVGDPPHEVPFEVRRVARVEREARDDERGHRDPHEIARPPAARSVDVVSDQLVAEAHPVLARRLIRQGAYSSGSLTSSGYSSLYS